MEEALAETGYIPNTVARNLRTRRTDTVGLLVPDMTNPFFTTLAHGVETASREAGVSLLLANSDEREEEEQRLVPMLLQRQVDGLLVVPAGWPRRRSASAESMACPWCSWTDAQRPRPSTACGRTRRVARSSSVGCSWAWAIDASPC